jgi:hypothetical protein
MSILETLAEKEAKEKEMEGTPVLPGPLLGFAAVQENEQESGGGSRRQQEQEDFESYNRCRKTTQQQSCSENCKM